MTFSITNEAEAARSGVNIKPQLVFEIDGVPTVYGAVSIINVIKIGDPGLVIGGGWVIGGSTPVANQADYITLDGTTTALRQQLNQDLGIGSSVQSMTIALIDKNGSITNLCTPGEVVEDILGRKAKVYLGFQGTNWPRDFITVFRGIIDQIECFPGKVQFNLAHPDQKKRQDLFLRAENQLDGSINDLVTTITVDSTTNFLAPVNGPSGANDTSLKFYVRIDDEVIRYTGTTGTTFTGCTRGALGTTAASHDNNSNVSSFYGLSGNAIDLALKLMLSGWNDYFIEDVEIESFNYVSASDIVANAIFFRGVDITDKYGISAGDYLTTSSATDGANNVTLKSIASVTVTDIGSYVVVNGVTFVDETDSPGVCSFRSQYDTLGEGLKMSPDEVDVSEHLRIYRLFLSSMEYDFYLKDTIQGKEFIEKELYNPAAAYSLPRKARASVGYHSPPIPGSQTTKVSQDNVTNPKSLAVKRSLVKNFFNRVTYKFDQDVLTDDLLGNTITLNSTSRDRFDRKSDLIIDSRGMRTSLGAVNLANTATTRRLNRYKFGAIFIDQIELMFRIGFSVEVGDVILLDAAGLKLSNLETGDRTSENIRLYEVVNKELDVKTGKIRVSVVDTNFSTASRYGLVSPASYIKAGVSTTQFLLKESFASIYGSDEYRKWNRFLSPGIRVRNSDFSRNATSVITGISGNQITVTPALGFTPSPNDILEFASYDNCTTEQKLVYAFMRDTTFSDGKTQYVQL